MTRTTDNVGRYVPFFFGLLAFLLCRFLFGGRHDRQGHVSLLEERRSAHRLSFFLHLLEGRFRLNLVLFLPAFLELGREALHTSRRIVRVQVRELKREDDVLKQWLLVGWKEGRKEHKQSKSRCEKVYRLSYSMTRRRYRKRKHNNNSNRAHRGKTVPSRRM